LKAKLENSFLCYFGFKRREERADTEGEDRRERAEDSGEKGVEGGEK